MGPSHGRAQMYHVSVEHSTATQRVDSLSYLHKYFQVSGAALSVCNVDFSHKGAYYGLF